VLPGVAQYLAAGCVPGGTLRNFDSYGARISALSDDQKHLLCDPQTSGGLLVAVTPAGEATFLAVAQQAGFDLKPIGQLVAQQAQAVVVR
jgi:selenide,water dikinase